MNYTMLRQQKRPEGAPFADTGATWTYRAPGAAGVTAKVQGLLAAQ